MAWPSPADNSCGISCVGSHAHAARAFPYGWGVASVGSALAVVCALSRSGEGEGASARNGITLCNRLTTRWRH